MRFRAAHLACVMLLLSTFGAANARTLARGDYAHRGSGVGIVLQQGASRASNDAFPRTAADASTPALPGAPVAHARPAWTLRPPATHTIAQHAVTGSGL